MDTATPKQIADFFLALCREHGDYLTNLKLQKLVYYAQAWFLALHDSPLFEDRIEAWIHGPVVPALYGMFKQHGWQPISESPEKPKLSDTVERHLLDVFRVYGGRTAWELELMTHQEQPWISARAGLEIDDPGDRVISHAEMKSFYRELAKRHVKKEAS